MSVISIQVSVISILVIVNVAAVRELKSIGAWQELGSALTITFWSTFSELSNRSISSVLGRCGHIWRVTNKRIA